MRYRRFVSSLLALPLYAGLTGCAGLGGLGSLGDILGGAGAQQGQVRAEVQSVDQSRQLIDVVTEDNRRGAIRYDQNTEVIYRQQRYPVTALERGDLVVLQLQQTRSGEPYAGRIDVEQSVQERTGQTGTGQLQVLQGRVGQIDHNQGAFQLQTSTGGTVVVTLPYNPSRQTVDQFNRLRQGEHVTIEGTYLSSTRVELSRFR